MEIISHFSNDEYWSPNSFQKGPEIFQANTAGSLNGTTFWGDQSLQRCGHFAGIIPSRKLTYPTWGKGKSSSNMPYQGDMLIPWRVVHEVVVDVIFHDPYCRGGNKKCPGNIPQKFNNSPRFSSPQKGKACLEFPAFFRGELLILGGGICKCGESIAMLLRCFILRWQPIRANNGGINNHPHTVHGTGIFTFINS